jgi:hypothetical protein
MNLLSLGYVIFHYLALLTWTVYLQWLVAKTFYSEMYSDTLHIKLSGVM